MEFHDNDEVMLSESIDQDILENYWYSLYIGQIGTLFDAVSGKVRWPDGN